MPVLFSRRFILIFQYYNDAILIVSGKNKKVGSSAGHALMEKNPFAEARYQQAMDHTIEMLQVLKSGNMKRFIEIVEQEALTLHGLMISSDPGYILMKQETIDIMDRIRSFRETTTNSCCLYPRCRSQCALIISGNHQGQKC